MSCGFEDPDCDIDVTKFAPFSHDAEGRRARVPEPATLLLLGLGMIPVALLTRYRR